MSLLTFTDIELAASRIKPYVHHTPVLSSTLLNTAVGAEVYLKSENLQKVGAFKARGACNAVFSLSDVEAEKGVIAHSSGNHGAAVAYAARTRGIPAVIVMPDNSLQCKFDAVRSYGAEVILCKPGTTAREGKQAEIIAQRGLYPIHPYNDVRVMAGQGTAALELVNEYPDIDILLTPVGGGGLLSGTSIVAKHFNKMAYGAEPELANAAFQSRQQGEHVKIDSSPTIADGLRSSIGTLNYQVLMENVDAFFCVKEEEIIPAQKWYMSRLKQVIEPSCAVPIAWLLTQPEIVQGKKIGVIMTGGNFDV